MKYLQAAHSVAKESGPETTAILLDLSPSMYEEDWPPNRLTAALGAVRSLLEVKRQQYPHDRIALVGFAGKALLLHETVDVQSGSASLQQTLQSIPRHIYGTNISEALQLSECSVAGQSPTRPKKRGIGRWIKGFIFETEEEPDYTSPVRNDTVRRIILLTDGEHNTGPAPIPISQSLKQAGIVIDCIGVGSRDEVDETTLKKIASRNPDGSIRYYYIGDKLQLIRKYRELARHIRPA